MPSILTVSPSMATRTPKTMAGQSCCLLQSLDAALAFGIPGLVAHVISANAVVDVDQGLVSLMMRNLDSKTSALAS